MIKMRKHDLPKAKHLYRTIAVENMHKSILWKIDSAVSFPKTVDATFYHRFLHSIQFHLGEEDFVCS